MYSNGTERKYAMVLDMLVLYGVDLFSLQGPSFLPPISSHAVLHARCLDSVKWSASTKPSMRSARPAFQTGVLPSNLEPGFHQAKQHATAGFWNGNKYRIQKALGVLLTPSFLNSQTPLFSWNWPGAFQPFSSHFHPEQSWKSGCRDPGLHHDFPHRHHHPKKPEPWPQTLSWTRWWSHPSMPPVPSRCQPLVRLPGPAFAMPDEPAAVLRVRIGTCYPPLCWYMDVEAKKTYH